MSQPGFTGEASLYKRSRPYQSALLHGNASASVVLQLRISQFPSSRNRLGLETESCEAMCGRISTACTYECDPHDFKCRSDCDDFFWACMSSCGWYT